jgi:D-alanyl-D-alanine dipeptidase
MPSFDYPDFTRRAGQVVSETRVPVPAGRPLPQMIYPDHLKEVIEPVDEPLVRIEHRRIRVLSSYWHARWENALPGTWLRREAMAGLAAVADTLPDRYGLAVFDAWRPLALQQEIYQAAYSDPDLPPGFVAKPSEDPATPPPHLTGGTVDLTLTIDGIPLALGTPYDDFTPAASADALEDAPSAERDLRRMLFWAMRLNGFVVLADEWWHFERGTRYWAALQNQKPRYGPAFI